MTMNDRETTHRDHIPGWSPDKHNNECLFLAKVILRSLHPTCYSSLPGVRGELVLVAQGDFPPVFLPELSV